LGAYTTFNRGVVYQSILCWLILIDLDASFLIFYDTERDALIRETLHISEAETRGLCGIAVCGDHIVKIWRQTEGIISYPELNVSMLGGDSGQWELDHTVRLSALGWDLVCLKGSGLQLLGGFVMNCHVQGEGKSSKPMVQLASRHITCVEDAAIFMALTAAVDLSIETCRPFSRKPMRGIRNWKENAFTTCLHPPFLLSFGYQTFYENRSPYNCDPGLCIVIVTSLPWSVYILAILPVAAQFLLLEESL